MSHSNRSAAVLNVFFFHFLCSNEKQGKYKKNKYEIIRQPYKQQWYSSFLLKPGFCDPLWSFYAGPFEQRISPSPSDSRSESWWPSGELQLWVVVTSLNTCSPRLLCLVSWPILERVLVAPNVFHCVQTDERIWEIHLYLKFLPRTAA